MNTSTGYRSELERLVLDCNRIAPHLYQGAAPPVGSAVAVAGFDTVVLCARELIRAQPASCFRGVEVLYCPIDDEGTKMDQGDPSRDWPRAVRTAQQVASRIRRGKRVLVTCAMGWNRSGLVCAMVLHYLTGEPGSRCVKHVQRARPNALSQPVFVRALCAVG